MLRKSDDQPVLCERVLTLDGRDVVIRLREPVLDPDEMWHEYLPDYRCAFEVDGLGEAVRGSGRGVDSLDAIVAARRCVAYALFSFRRELRDTNGEGSYDWEFGYGVTLADAGRRKRVRAIIDEEMDKLAQDQIEREVLRRAKGGHPLSEAGTDIDTTGANDPSEQSDDRSEGPNADLFLQPALCTRRLQWNGVHEIVVKIWRPSQVEDAGRVGYLCGFQLTGLDNRRQTAFSEDAMTTLFQAICAVDAYLEPHRLTLTWFGGLPYPDPAFANVLDAGRRLRIHDVIGEEIYANAEREREQRDYRELEDL